MMLRFLAVGLLCVEGVGAATIQPRSRPGQSCTPSISIQAIGGQPVAQMPVSVPEVPGTTVDGKSLSCQRGTSGISAGLLIRRVFDDAWFLTGVDTPAAVNGAERSWSIRDVAFPMPDLGKGYKVYAFLAPRSVGRFPNGAADYDAVRRLALVISAPVDAVRVNEGSPVVFPGRCSIELSQVRNVDGEMQSAAGSQQKAIEVEDLSDVSGRFDRPDNKHLVYLVVTPSGSEKRWVMPRKGSASGTDWTENAYFGRKGIDAGEAFRMQAFISTQALSARDYSMDEWRGIEPGICAMSKEVLLKRRIAPGDLVIRKIDEKDVTRAPMDVDFDFPLEGSVEETRPDTMLRAGENVWILARRAKSDEGWTVKSVAIVSADGYAFKANLHFPAPGPYIVMALASTIKLARGQVVSEDLWSNAASARRFRRISRTVQILVGGVNAPR